MYKKFLWLSIFSIAMGFLEAAVVIYLRKIYYANGFQFPLTTIDPSIASVEFFREAATIIMLLAIGMLTGTNNTGRFAVFIFCFAVWDIFYYVFLGIFTGWPTSLYTWDILFIIPIPWVGPVLAPCIVSLTMIGITASVFYSQRNGDMVYFKAREWALMAAGCLIIIFSFTQDYCSYCIVHNRGIVLSGKQSLFGEISDYVPVHFNWWIFAGGELLLVLVILSFILRMKNTKPD